MKRQTLWLVVVVILLVGLISSGWVYNILKQNSQLVKGNEMATLQTAFMQKHGNEAVIKQVVSPEKVYAIVWSQDGVTYVDWSIGGVLATVLTIPTTP